MNIKFQLVIIDRSLSNSHGSGQETRLDSNGRKRASRCACRGVFITDSRCRILDA